MKTNRSLFHGLARPPRPLSRREFLWHSGGGLGGIALASLLGTEAWGAGDTNPTNKGTPAPRQPHYPAKAKRVVQMFMAGAASHVDTFDYKPELIKRAGEKWDPGEKV